MYSFLHTKDNQSGLNNIFKTDKALVATVNSEYIL